MVAEMPCRMVTDALAHDLRSPVSRLRAAAHAAAETSDGQEQEELLGSVIRQADSLMRILTTVLEISRSDARFSACSRRWDAAGRTRLESLCSALPEPPITSFG